MAPTNCLSEETFRSLNMDSTFNKNIANVRLVSLSNHYIRQLGRVTCRIWNPEYDIQFYVIKEKTADLLGVEDIVRTKLMTRNSQLKEMFTLEFV